MTKKVLFDLNFRPHSYWDDENEAQNVAGRVKGEFRRRQALEGLESGLGDEQSVPESLSAEDRRRVGRIHPHLMGGEYLPDLGPDEVEIARIVMESTTLDVISIRARRDNNKIHYRIVDEYDPEFWEQEYTLIYPSTDHPLSLQEIIDLIDNTREGGLVGFYRYLNYEEGDHDPRDYYDFETADSLFYPQLSEWYDQSNKAWLDLELEKRAQRRADRENVDQQNQVKSGEEEQKDYTELFAPLEDLIEELLEDFAAEEGMSVEEAAAFIMEDFVVTPEPDEKEKVEYGDATPGSNELPSHELKHSEFVESSPHRTAIPESDTTSPQMPSVEELNKQAAQMMRDGMRAQSLTERAQQYLLPEDDGDITKALRRQLLRQADEIMPVETELWDELAAESDHPDPLSCGSAWQMTAHCNPHGPRPPILLRQSSDSQIAFALIKHREIALLKPLEHHWGFGSPLIGHDAVQLMSNAISDLRAASEVDRIEVEISGLEPDGLHARQIDREFSLVDTYRQDPAAIASLKGGIDGWMSRRSANFRRNLRRAVQKAQTAGIQFERHAPIHSDDAETLYDRMLAVERSSWKGARKGGLLQLPVFYRQLLQAYARRKMARVVIAKQSDRDIGFCFGGAEYDVYRGQQCSYDNAAAQFSVGTLMHFETTKWLCKDRMQLQHFGPNQLLTPGKDRFCEVQRKSVIKVIQF